VEEQDKEFLTYADAEAFLLILMFRWNKDGVLEQKIRKYSFSNDHGSWNRDLSKTCTGSISGLIIFIQQIHHSSRVVPN